MKRASARVQPVLPDLLGGLRQNVLTDASGRFQIDDLRAGLKFKLLP